MELQIWSPLKWKISSVWHQIACYDFMHTIGYSQTVLGRCSREGFSSIYRIKGHSRVSDQCLLDTCCNTTFIHSRHLVKSSSINRFLDSSHHPQGLFHAPLHHRLEIGETWQWAVDSLLLLLFQDQRSCVPFTDLAYLATLGYVEKHFWKIQMTFSSTSLRSSSVELTLLLSHPPR